MKELIERIEGAEGAGPEPVGIPVDHIFEVVNQALLYGVSQHGNKSKAFAWDVSGYLLKEWGHLRSNALSRTATAKDDR